MPEKVAYIYVLTAIMRTSEVIMICSSLVSCNTYNQRETEFSYPIGGYNYTESINDKDTNFYCLPVKDLISTQDSFSVAYYEAHWYTAFNEPNLSLKPQSKSVFRFMYFDGALSSMKPILIKLTSEEILVKQGISGYLNPEHDTTKLNKLERYHFNILEWNFYLYDTIYYSRLVKYYNSEIKRYPELLDPTYYRYLLDKSAVFKEPFTYKEERIPISRNIYIHLITLINESGYWKLPFEYICSNMPMDAASFSLEANTPKKYNIVRSASCSDDTSKFVKACQELIKYSNLENKIQLIWDGSTQTVDTSHMILKPIELKEERQPT